jgi:hypothetical protein
MNLYNNIFNVLLEHLAKIEMNLMGTKYSKTLSKSYNQCLHYLKDSF